MLKQMTKKKLANLCHCEKILPLTRKSRDYAFLPYHAKEGRGLSSGKEKENNDSHQCMHDNAEYGKA